MLYVFGGGRSAKHIKCAQVGTFYAFGARETCSILGTFCVQRKWGMHGGVEGLEGMGSRHVEHVKHATLDVFYVFDRWGWVGMVFSRAGGQYAGSLV